MAAACTTATTPNRTAAASAAERPRSTSGV
jgi:hypothetical protein